MTNKPLSHDELQHIEHANKVLEEHLELVNKVVETSNKLFETYLPIFQNYVNGMGEVQRAFGEHVVSIYKSSRELKVITGSTQEVITFTSAVEKLDKTLSPELIAKLKGVLK